MLRIFVIFSIMVIAISFSSLALAVKNGDSMAMVEAEFGRPPDSKYISLKGEIWTYTNTKEIMIDVQKQVLKKALIYSIVPFAGISDIVQGTPMIETAESLTARTIYFNLN